MQADQDHYEAAAPVRVQVVAADFNDVRQALREDARVFARRPGLSLLFGAIFALFGAVLIAGLTWFDQIWIVIAAGVGFLLFAPFLTAGLYEMSRRYPQGEVLPPPTSSWWC
ncbi:MAG: DUF2189 domain-containing protein [Rhodospirillaceae bacterium]